MSWFNQQMEERQEADQRLLEESFAKVAGVVLGKRTSEKIRDSYLVARDAIDEILKFYHYKPVQIPEEIRTAEEQLNYCMQPHGMMRRRVELTEKWYQDAFGPLLAYTREDHLPVALLPHGSHGYVFTDPRTGKREKIGPRTASLFEKDAYCFYRPLPQKKLGIPDLILYMRRCVSLDDNLLFLVLTLAVTLVGMVIPRITRALTGPVLAAGNPGVLPGVAICVLCVSLSSQLLSSMKNLIQKRLEIKVTLGVQASMMMRLMSLPASFFRQYSPGELKSRASSVNRLCSTMMSMALNMGLTSLTSLLYITQIFRFAPGLVVPAFASVAVTVGFSILSTSMQIRVDRKQMELRAREAGVSYALLTGIQKIRLAGTEKRAFAKWLNLYAEGAALRYDPPTFLKINSVISLAISLLSNILLYDLAVRSGMDPSSYFAFTAAYGMLMGAFMSVSSIALSVAQYQPVMEMADPFLKTEPETAEQKEFVTTLGGGLELDHVSFRYDQASPWILEDLSLRIRPGEYVALVGRTGCGKSTLVRLLLGFEKPEKGSVFYDGRDIDSLDLPSLRRKIGTVMQDAGLFQGDIYSNIVITAPELTVQEAWEAAETAGIAEEIRAMPMGMNTMVSEGQGGISGGQRQRLMIARAIAPKPRVLIFDEATSALDNRTQRQVSDALDKMGCTRLVIAHRLSTIRHCDRILVLDGGHIVEDGTYEELIEKGGFFAELVERQRLERTEA